MLFWRATTALGASAVTPSSRTVANAVLESNYSSAARLVRAATERDCSQCCFGEQLQRVIVRVSRRLANAFLESNYSMSGEDRRQDCSQCCFGEQLQPLAISHAARLKCPHCSQCCFGEQLQPERRSHDARDRLVTVANAVLESNYSLRRSCHTEWAGEHCSQCCFGEQLQPRGRPGKQASAFLL